MLNRRRVEGTEPTISIGQRPYRRKDGSTAVCSTWHAEWCARGRQRAKTLGTSDLPEAIRAAHALCQRIIDGVEARQPHKITIDTLRLRYVEVLTNRGRAPRTLAKYTYVLKEFADWWQRKSGRPAATFIESDLWEYRAFLQREQKSPKSISDRLILVKQLFKWGAGKGKLLTIDPLADATVSEPVPTPQPCFTPEQVEQLLARAKPNERDVFTLMAYTGLRLGEVIELRWEDVLLHRGTHGFIHVRLGGSNGTTKGKRPRLIPIHPRLRTVLDALPRKHSTVFTRPASRHCPKGDRPLNPSQLLGAIKRLCRDCGFPDWKRYKVHTWRHAFASMCARSQVSYRYALGWMGHKRSDILDMYITMYDTAAEGAMQTINYESRPAAAPTAVAIAYENTCLPMRPSTG